MTVDQLRALIADDAYALTFQSFAQYRTALLRIIDKGKKIPIPSCPDCGEPNLSNDVSFSPCGKSL